MYEILTDEKKQPDTAMKNLEFIVRSIIAIAILIIFIAVILRFR